MSTVSDEPGSLKSMAGSKHRTSSDGILAAEVSHLCSFCADKTFKIAVTRQLELHCVAG
jgi:hypothetical protein